MTRIAGTAPQMANYAANVAPNNYNMPSVGMAPGRAQVMPILTAKAYAQIMNAVQNTGQMMQQLNQYGGQVPPQMLHAASQQLAANFEAIRSALDDNTGHSMAGSWRRDTNGQPALDTSFDAAAAMRRQTFTVTSPRDQLAFISSIANNAQDWAAANNVPMHKGVQALLTGGPAPHQANTGRYPQPMPQPGYGYQQPMPQPGYMQPMPQPGYTMPPGYMPGGMGQMPNGIGNVGRVNGVTDPGFGEPTLQEAVGLAEKYVGGRINDANKEFAATVMNTILPDTALPGGKKLTGDQVLALANGKTDGESGDSGATVLPGNDKSSVEDIAKARATEIGDLVPLFHPILDALKTDGPEDAKNNLALLFKTLGEAFGDVAKSKDDIAPIGGNPELDGSAESGPFELNADKLGAIGKALMIAAGGDKGDRNKIMDFIRSAFADLDYGVITDKEASGIYDRLAKLTKSLDLEPDAAHKLLQSVFKALESQ